MSAWDTLFLVSCSILAVVPPLFIWNRVYKDGIVGRSALAGISFFSLAFILRAWDGRAPDIDGLGLCLHASFAAFLVWHLWRFHRRVLNRDSCPTDCPQDRRKSPERRFVAN